MPSGLFSQAAATSIRSDVLKKPPLVPPIDHHHGKSAIISSWSQAYFRDPWLKRVAIQHKCLIPHSRYRRLWSRVVGLTVLGFSCAAYPFSDYLYS